jgi:hypothetical protein
MVKKCLCVSFFAHAVNLFAMSFFWHTAKKVKTKIAVPDDVRVASSCAKLYT